MKGIMLRVPEDLLARRRKTGEDRWDEVWNGVLHMTPAPSFEHQRILDELVAFLLPLVKETGRGVLRSGVNVCDATTGWENYRIPDLTFVAAGRESVIAPDGIRFGAPDAVIEIRSPEDETYDKLPFLAKVGVREVLVIDCDTKQIEVLTLETGEYVRGAVGEDGWWLSTALGIRLRTANDPPRLLLADSSNPAVAAEI